jgi:hypothetical protein
MMSEAFKYVHRKPYAFSIFLIKKSFMHPSPLPLEHSARTSSGGHLGNRSVPEEDFRPSAGLKHI